MDISNESRSLKVDDKFDTYDDGRRRVVDGLQASVQDHHNMCEGCLEWRGPSTPFDPEESLAHDGWKPSAHWLFTNGPGLKEKIDDVRCIIIRK